MDIPPRLSPTLIWDPPEGHSWCSDPPHVHMGGLEPDDPDLGPCARSRLYYFLTKKKFSPRHILVIMPRRKKTDRKVTKRKTRKPRFLPLGGFAASQAVRLRYVDTFNLDPGIGGMDVQVFRASSMFDPDFTGGGHQPSNWDRVTAIWDRYTVIGAKCVIYPVQTGTGNQTPGTLCLHLSEDGTDLATAHASGGINNVLEQPHTRRSIRNMGAGYPSQDKQTFTIMYSPKKYYGGRFTVGLEPYSADVNSNPNENTYFEIGYASSDNTNNPGVMTFRVEIEYIGVMQELQITDNS